MEAQLLSETKMLLVINTDEAQWLAKNIAKSKPATEYEEMNRTWLLNALHAVIVTPSTNTPIGA